MGRDSVYKLVKYDWGYSIVSYPKNPSGLIKGSIPLVEFSGEQFGKSAKVRALEFAKAKGLKLE